MPAPKKHPTSPVFQACEQCTRPQDSSGSNVTRCVDVLYRYISSVVHHSWFARTCRRCRCCLCGPCWPSPRPNTLPPPFPSHDFPDRARCVQARGWAGCQFMGASRLGWGLSLVLRPGTGASVFASRVVRPIRQPLCDLRRRCVRVYCNQLHLAPRF